MNNVKFYIKREGDTNYIELESYFNGMKYMKCVGLEDLGKPKNIYTETYADASTLRVFNPETITREATKITFTFLFLGDKYTRHNLYDRFNRFIENKIIYYYDTARLRLAHMILLEHTSPKEDLFKGGGNMVVDYTFQNIRGYCDRIIGVPTDPNNPEIADPNNPET